MLFRSSTEQQTNRTTTTSRHRASTKRKLSEEPISDHTISRTFNHLPLEGVSVHRLRRSVRGHHTGTPVVTSCDSSSLSCNSSIWFTSVDPDRPPSSSRAEEECGNTRNTQMGPVPRWGLVFLQKGKCGCTRVIYITAPFYPAHVDASDLEFSNS